MENGVKRDAQVWDREAVAAIVSELREQPGALLPILHAINARLGYVPAPSVDLIAQALNLSRAEVHGVLSFYHDFRHAPAGRNLVRLCRAESCQALGAGALAAELRARLGIDFGQTSGDGTFTLEAVYCLGNCACSPAMVINGALHGRVTPSRLGQLLAELESAGGPLPAPDRGPAR